MPVLSLCSSVMWVASKTLRPPLAELAIAANAAKAGHRRGMAANLRQRSATKSPLKTTRRKSLKAMPGMVRAWEQGFGGRARAVATRNRCLMLTYTHPSGANTPWLEYTICLVHCERAHGFVTLGACTLAVM